MNRRELLLGAAAASVAATTPSWTPVAVAAPPVQELEYTIHISESCVGVNLRETFRRLFGDEVPKSVKFFVHKDVSLESPEVGDWPKGTMISLVNDGELVGGDHFTRKIAEELRRAQLDGVQVRFG